MALKREVSLGVGLATAALVWGIYQVGLPSIAEARVAAPRDADLSGAERAATGISAAVVAGVSLIAKDPTVFILGGAMTVAMSWWHRHANHVDPTIGAATIPSSRRVMDNANADMAGYTPTP